MTALNLSNYIRDVPDFPKPGIVFKDITPLLADTKALHHAIDSMTAAIEPLGVDKIAGIESRGFLFGVPVARDLGVGFIPIRKAGKLPWRTRSVEYELEYGSDTIQIHEDAIQTGERVAIIDDLLATGGTMAASVRLIEALGGRVAACSVVIELGFLKGRKRIHGHELQTLVSFD